MLINNSLSEEKWDRLVKERLLSSGFIEGVALLSSTKANCIYALGMLKREFEQIPQSSAQFASLFSNTEPFSSSEVIERYFIDGWRLCGLKFCVFRKTEWTIYATTRHKQFGLSVSCLPFGVFLCLFSTRILSQAVLLIEQFCDTLRHLNDAFL
jgi:hypothetical protein